MSNIASFLRDRELGCCNKKWSLSDKVEDFYDEIASKPVLNKACTLSRRCRATFLVDFSPDRTKIASTHGDHSVRVTEIATGKCTHVLEGHPRTPWCLSFHPSSNEIVGSGCLDGEVRIWDLFGGGSEVWRCKEHSVIASLAFHPTDNLLVFAAGTTIYFWDWSKPEPFACCSTKHEYERVRYISFHPLGQYLYTGITNTTTLQQTNPSRVSYTSGSGRSNCQSQRTQRLSNVYDNLVECYQTYQRDRVINLTSAGSGHITSYPERHNPDVDTPQSPVHEEGLSFARQYARHITETAASAAAEQVIIPSDDLEQGPSSSHPPPVISEDLSWSPPPRTAPPEDDVDMQSVGAAQLRPVVIVSSMDERSDSWSTSSPRRTAGIIGNRTNFLQRQIYGHDINGGESASSNSSLSNLRNDSWARRSGTNYNCGPSSVQRSSLDHSNCDGHCDVCSNYNLTFQRRSNQSSLQLRQDRLENRRRYCRDRLSYLRRRQSRLTNFNELSSIHSDRSSNSFAARMLNRQLTRSLVLTTDQAGTNGEMPLDPSFTNRQSINVISGHNPQGEITSETNSEVSASSSSLTESYDNIRENFVSITARLEQEMNELDRRINELRNSFQESIRQLQADHGIGEDNDGQTSQNDVPLNQQVTRPVITVTRCRESHDGDQNQQGNQQSRDRTHLLETALRTSVSSPRQAQPTPLVVTSNQSARTEAPSNTWQTLQRHHLHPHYSVSILDDTINRPQDAVQRAINHTIAGAFMGRGEAAVASNIVNQTYRIQAWNLFTNPVPDLSDETVNVVVPHCKLHNDASCDISQDGTLLATFAPSHRGFPDDNIMAVYSLRPETLGHCLYTKSFGPNAISVSISPKNQHVLVGLAAKRLIWVFTTNQLVAQIYKLESEKAGENSTKHVVDILHPCDVDMRSHVSVNSARWLPTPGHGLVYGTNRGDLQICTPGSLQVSEEEEGASTAKSISRNLLHMLGGISHTPVTVNSIATQTPAVRRSMSTQTEESDSNVIVCKSNRKHSK